LLKRISFPAAALLTLVFALQAAAPQKAALTATYKKWLEEEVVYLITPLERDVFLKLQSDRERDLFIEAFWKHRDPNPGAKENAFKTEHYKRIAYANRYYGRSAPIPGWRTDRGRIYIILGEPGDIQRFTGSQGVYPAEVWFYQDKKNLGLETGFNLLFYQERGIGDYKLYSPAVNGPQALLTAYLGNPSDYVTAYQQLRELMPALADVSMSLIPGEGNPMLGRPTLVSDMLIQKVENLPRTMVEERYAQKFLEFKDSVEVEYSANYLDSNSLVHILRDPGGLYFVHFAIEPKRLSIADSGSGFAVNLKVNGTVSALDGKMIYQFDRAITITLSEAQKAEADKMPFDYHDMFPLIPGTYRISVLIKNESSKEFTSLEERIIIPASAPGIQMTAPILGYKIAKADAARKRLKPFQVGVTQVYCQPGRVFARSDTLTTAFQLFGLTPAQRDAAVVRYAITRSAAAGQPAPPAVETTRPLREYADPAGILESFPLADFAPAHYALKVAVSVDGRDIVSASDEFDVSHRTDIPRPWFYSRLIPGAADPESDMIVGTELVNSGRAAEALTYLERASQRKPDSVDAALALAQAYLSLGEAPRVPALLAPFLAATKAPKYEVFVLAGQTYGKLGEYAKAISILDQSVTRFGINAVLLNEMGENYARLGQVREALAAFDKSLQLNPKQPEIQKKAAALREKK
jgi:GWxTD domain-containing protein